MALMDDGWEGRMAARAAERRMVSEREQAEADRIAWDRYTEQLDADLAAQMTLGHGAEVLRAEPHGCACAGGTWCCMRQRKHAERLQRGAHIVAKMLADYRP